MGTQDNEKADSIEWPSPAWGAEWLRQATPTTMEGAISYAATRLAGLDGLTCGLTPRDLVHEAVLATGDGVIRWRPERVTLCAHLCDRVSVMLRRMRRAAARTVQLDHIQEHDKEGQWIERESLSYTPDLNRAVDIRTAGRAFEAALWRLAAHDQPALAFMNAMLNGADDDHDVMTMTGLSLSEVRAARRRLRRAAKALPVVVRQHARSLIS